MHGGGGTKAEHYSLFGYFQGPHFLPVMRVAVGSYMVLCRAFSALPSDGMATEGIAVGNHVSGILDQGHR